MTKARSMITTGVILALVPFLAAPVERSYVSGNFSVDIADAGSFMVKSIAGGSLYATPTVRGQRQDKYPNKEPGQIKCEDLTLQTGFWAPKGLWDWVGAFASPETPAARRVTVAEMDYNFVEKSRRAFDGAALSQVVIPACDGASKEPAYATITLTPASVREIAPPAGAKPAQLPSTQTKTWLPSNFRLTIDGLVTTRVNKIDAITIKRSGSTPEYSNLSISLADVDADSWKQWAAQFFAAGGKGLEKRGKLELLNPSRTEVLMTLNFDGLGVIAVGPEKAEANADQIKRFRAELYVEKITFGAK